MATPLASAPSLVLCSAGLFLQTTVDTPMQGISKYFLDLSEGDSYLKADSPPPFDPTQAFTISVRAALRQCRLAPALWPLQPTFLRLSRSLALTSSRCALAIGVGPHDAHRSRTVVLVRAVFAVGSRATLCFDR